MSTPRHPIRLAHLGLGAFSRAHQAWYTQAANDRGADWGIAAFTGRTPDIARELSAQNGRYTLITRAANGDSAQVIDSIVSASDGADNAAWTSTLANPDVAVVTVTVTEAGYLPAATPPRRLAEGLRARRAAASGPIAIVSCDNVPANGTKLKELVLQQADNDLSEWIHDNVSFVVTMVDRITPAATDEDRRIARGLVGWDDRVPVVTEPFSEWVLQGEFPAGRPDWHEVGAQFVDDVEPYENRKLWLLNAGHSLLAYRGLERGHSTVFDAFADETLRGEVEQLWTEARPVLALPADEVDAWLEQLRTRWQNPRIEHRLAQVAQGGEQKVPARILSVAHEREAAGLPPGEAGAEVVAAWNRYRKTTGAS
ncbi:MAG: mannitol dehydrogenase family protein [Glaciihabitans sp.]|nr:mannitol dehydrogenase family protein [Glaciihabitans sp.]